MTNPKLRLLSFAPRKGAATAIRLTRVVALCLSGTMALATGSAEAAVITWSNAGAGDWFDSTNWSLAVPGAADDVFINNGGDATADSSSGFYPGAGTFAETSNLNIGYRDDALPVAPYGTGSLHLNDVGLAVGGDLRIGVTDAPVFIMPQGDSNGVLTTTGGANNDGDVTVGGAASIGEFIDGVATGTATGAATIAGDFTGMETDGLIVGRTEGAGDADGSLSVGGDVSGFTSLQVGVTGLGSTGDATGVMDVGGSLSRTPGGGFISVGTVAGNGVVNGDLTVGNGINGFLSIGVGGGTADPAAIGSGGGTLTVTGGGIHSGTNTGVSFEVGNTNANGTTMGVANVTGDIDGYAQIEVGNVRGTTSTGSATGDATIIGNLTGLGTDAMRVGRTEGAGDADGALSVSGDVSEFASLQIGVTGLDSTGNATGVMDVGGSLSRTPGGGFISVGTVAGDGVSSGDLTVGNGINGFFSIGVGGGTADPDAMGSSTALLTVNAGGIHSGTNGISFEVGNTNANGTTMGVANVIGDIDGYAQIEVGNARGSASQTGSATGDATIIGNLTGLDTDGLRVGRTESLGDADGALSVSGDVSGFTSLQIGATGLDSNGNALGVMDVGGSLSRTTFGGFISVGTMAGNGVSNGSLTVGSGISGFNSIGVGGGTADPAAMGSSAALLTVNAGGVHSNGAGISFEVGNVNANGSTSGVANITGDVDGYAQIEVGNARGSASQTGSATGDATIIGNLTGLDTDGLRVGRTESLGDADGSLSVSGDVSGFTSLQIGATGLDSNGNATGVMDVGGSLSRGTFGGFISVGAAAGNGVSAGSLTVGNGISGFNSIGVGGGTADPDATGISGGVLTVLAGGVHSGGSGFSFEVGNTNAAPSTLGVANITGGITGYDLIEVGNVRGATSTGNATGYLNISDGPVTASTMRVGVSEGGIGVGTGTVNLDHTLMTLDDALTLGAGATLSFDIDGMNRGVDYAAIDASTASLDGDLEVDFSFNPTPSVYDLIVSDSIGGILGDFDNVYVLGLAASIMYSYGVEVANIGGFDVDVYRLHIFGDGGELETPLPAASFFFLSGLAGFIGFRRRRRAVCSSV